MARMLDWNRRERQTTVTRAAFLSAFRAGGGQCPGLRASIRRHGVQTHLDLLGYCAALLTTGAFVPKAIKTIRSYQETMLPPVQCTGSFAAPRG